MRLLSGMMLAVCFLCGSLSVAQDKSKSMPMKKEAMAAKKMMMEPRAMESAKMMMMDEKSMVPMMVAKEMMHQEMMHDTRPFSGAKHLSDIPRLRLYRIITQSKYD